MNKRGQFFLIAAVIIISLFASLVVVHNQANAPKEDYLIYDLNREIAYESARNVDTSVYQNDPEAQLNAEIENLTSIYARLNPKTDFVFVYSNESEVVFLQYRNTNTGSVSVSLGGNNVDIPVSEQRFQRATRERTTENNLELRLEDNSAYFYSFRDGKNFFALIKKENEEEKFIAVSEE